MIEFLRGKVAALDADRLVIDVNGVGYSLLISDSTAALMPGIGEETKVYTYMSVREDGVSLFGFPSLDDLKIFKSLITVSGIGPKGALAILSVLTPDDLRFAILSGDAKAIAKAPGIGKKTAERVILDLKDRLSAGDIISTENSGYSAAAVKAGSARDEAVEALVALGYTSSDAYRAVKEAGAALGEDAEADTILKAALKVISAF